MTTSSRRCDAPRRNPITRLWVPASRLHDPKVGAGEREAPSGENRDDQPPLILHLHAGRLRVGYFLLCACVAVYGGWHWFGSSGLALVALWFEVRLRSELAPASGDFSLYLDQVDWVRVDPWRVTVAFSERQLWPMGAAPRAAQTAAQAVNRGRIDFFRDELDGGQWSELRRRLLVQMIPRRTSDASVTITAKG